MSSVRPRLVFISLTNEMYNFVFNTIHKFNFPLFPNLKIYLQSLCRKKISSRTQPIYCRSLWDPKVCSSSIDYKEARNHNIKELLPYNKWHSSHDFSLLPSPFSTICDLSCLLFKSFEIWLLHVRVEHSQFVRKTYYWYYCCRCEVTDYLRLQWKEYYPIEWCCCLKNCRLW